MVSNGMMIVVVSALTATTVALQPIIHPRTLPLKEVVSIPPIPMTVLSFLFAQLAPQAPRSASLSIAPNAGVSPLEFLVLPPFPSMLIVALAAAVLLSPLQVWSLTPVARPKLVKLITFGVMVNVHVSLAHRVLPSTPNLQLAAVHHVLGRPVILGSSKV